MSAEDEGKTEDPTAKRLKNARQEGDLPIGKDAVQTASLLVGLAVLGSVAVSLRDVLTDAVKLSLTGLYDTDFRDFVPVGIKLSLLTLTAIAAAGISAVLIHGYQSGFQLWTDKLAPDFSKLFEGSLAALKKPFSLDFWKDTSLTLAKLAIVTWAGWSVLGPHFDTMNGLFNVDSANILGAMFGPLADAGRRMLMVLVGISAFDYWLTRRRYMDKLKMTKDEVKREFKNDEGDPMIKGKRRAKARELARQRIRSEVPRADAIVVNPQHVAVAIRYRKAEGSAPRVTAKGMGALAELMKDLARSNGIPIVPDVALARLLYRRVRLGGSVPEQTYKAVAAILVFVYKITGRRPG